MRMTAIHNEIMRTRTLPIQCRTNDVDSHSGNNINRALDSYIISVLPGQTIIIIVFQIMAEPHTNCNRISDCCFLQLMIMYQLKKSQEIRVAESIFQHCLLTIPFQHIRLFLAPAVTAGETEGAMDSTSVFFASSFAYNFVRK